MLRCLLWVIAAAIRPKVLLVADNLCLRQQLVVLQRRKPRPRLEDADRRFWMLACRWFASWRTSLLIVKPETVLRWHRQGWRAYWRRRSYRIGSPGRRPIAPKFRGEPSLGVSGGSRRSSRRLGSKFQRERSPSICVEAIIAGLLPGGSHSCGSTRQLTGRAISSASKPSRFEHCTCSS